MKINIRMIVWAIYPFLLGFCLFYPTSVNAVTNAQITINAKKEDGTPVVGATYSCLITQNTSTIAKFDFITGSNGAFTWNINHEGTGYNCFNTGLTPSQCLYPAASNQTNFTPTEGQNLNIMHAFLIDDFSAACQPVAEVKIIPQPVVTEEATNPTIENITTTEETNNTETSIENNTPEDETQTVTETDSPQSIDPDNGSTSSTGILIVAVVLISISTLTITLIKRKEILQQINRIISSSQNKGA